MKSLSRILMWLASTILFSAALAASDTTIGAEAHVQVERAIAIADEALGGRTRPDTLEIVTVKLYSTPANEILGKSGYEEIGQN
jgi:hypothetical protein